MRPFRNPANSLIVTPVLAFGVSSLSGARLIVGGNVGYAVLDGVLPAVGVLAGVDSNPSVYVNTSITLTPPVRWPLTPFALGEAGRSFGGFLPGWRYGGGVGVYIGPSSASIGLQLGYRWLRYEPNEGRGQTVGAPFINLPITF